MISTQVTAFVQSRRKLMQFYEKCYVVGNTVAIVNYEELLETVQSIKE